MRIIKGLKKKLNSKRGETLTETIVSLLIVVPAMVMLAGAIVTAARINSEARNSKASNYPDFTTASESSGSISGAGDVTFSGGSIKWCHETDSIYYYFR